MKNTNHQIILYAAFLLLYVASVANAQVAAISSDLCNIVGIVRALIGLLALVLFIIGGALYAVGHFLPQAGQIKQNLQGWSMGMVLGGIIGVVLVLIAPFAINMIIGFGGNTLAPVGC